VAREPSVIVAALVLLVAFALCAWGGRTLAGHYQDWWEVAATLAVGVCVVGALALDGGGHDATAGWPEAALGLAMAAGLFTGYYRAADRRGT
jgi:hypothetical protein